MLVEERVDLGICVLLHLLGEVLRLLPDRLRTGLVEDRVLPGSTRKTWRCWDRTRSSQVSNVVPVMGLRPWAARLSGGVLVPVQVPWRSQDSRAYVGHVHVEEAGRPAFLVRHGDPGEHEVAGVVSLVDSAGVVSRIRTVGERGAVFAAAVGAALMVAVTPLDGTPYAMRVATRGRAMTGVSLPGVESVTGLAAASSGRLRLVGVQAGAAVEWTRASLTHGWTRAGTPSAACADGVPVTGATVRPSWAALGADTSTIDLF